MKSNLFGMIMTFFIASAILISGYEGITYIGEKILDFQGEITTVSEDKKLNEMFYSKTDEEILLFPWNYYEEDKSETKQAYSGNEEKFTDVFRDLVLYSMGMSEEELKEQLSVKSLKKTFQNFKSMEIEGKGMFYFYQKNFSLKNKKEFLVECVLDENGQIISYECREQHENETMLSKQEIEREASLVKILGEKKLNFIYMILYMENSVDYYKNAMVIMNEIVQYNIFDTVSGNLESVRENLNDTDSSTYYKEKEISFLEQSLQIVDLLDRVLIIPENNKEIILYYDVITEKVTGFHLRGAVGNAP